jgi:predicted transcriptional regulator
VVDITEILIHWNAGRSIGEVARSLGVDHNTVRKYIRPAVEAGMTPGGEPVSLPRWGELVREWFLSLSPPSCATPSSPRSRPTTS